MELYELLECLNNGAVIAAGSEAHKAMLRTSYQAMALTAALNNSYHEPDEIRTIFSQITGEEVDESFGLFPPFYTDFGKNIHIGKGVFINSGCHFQDQGGITIGDGTLIGHNVVLATINHDIAPARRGDNHPSPIHIGKQVWIGANVTVVPGITVGDGAIIAAGAVVTHNVPSKAVVGGVPARVLYMIESPR